MTLSFHLADDALELLAQRVAEIVLERQPAQTTSSRWLTIDQAAEYIGANRQRVYDLRSSGRLSRTGDGSRVLVDRLELDRLIGGV